MCLIRHTSAKVKKPQNGSNVKRSTKQPLNFHVVPKKRELRLITFVKKQNKTLLLKLNV